MKRAVNRTGGHAPKRLSVKRRGLWAALAGLVAMLLVLAIVWHLQGPAGTAPTQAIARIFAPTQARSTLPQGRVYFVDRRAEGYQLMASDVPGASIPLALLPDHFGAYPTDTVAALSLAPGGAYLAIDAQRDHGDSVWIVTTATGDLLTVPPDATGNFLHWLPDGQHFLFRAFLPVGAIENDWAPGLWIVDAATGTRQVVTLPGNDPQAQVIDAISTPDGTGLMISLSSGLGSGSTVWQSRTNGTLAQQMWASAATVGLFAWSPDGQQLAYETLADSAVPYQPAGLWVYSPTAHQQRQVAETDGGHGFAPAWSPDSQQIAFVARLNGGNGQANALAGQLVSAIHSVSLTTGAETTVAGPDQTALPRNVSPAWSADGTLLFTALAASDAGGAAIGRAWLWHAGESSAHTFAATAVGNASLSSTGGLFALVP